MFIIGVIIEYLFSKLTNGRQWSEMTTTVVQFEKEVIYLFERSIVTDIDKTSIDKQTFITPPITRVSWVCP